MVFSSAIFLFCFLPAVFLLYRLPFGRRWQNALLACASLVFYAFGNLHYVPLFLLSVLLNYATGLLLGGRLQRSKPLIALNIVLNLGILCVFKYTDFLIGNANALFGLTLKPVGLILPIGISFYTFQGLSYTIDVYRKPEEYSRSFLKLLLYISFFPQLIAGPIVRWGDIAAQIDERVCTPEKTSAGIRRFLVGLGKKLLLADTAAIAADAVFAASLPDARLAWLGGICYSLQIYFDFSGYSDTLPLHGRFDPRLLAEMAHLAVHLVSRISLHSAGRQPLQPGPGGAEPPDRLLLHRSLARRQLDLCALGSGPRPAVESGGQRHHPGRAPAEEHPGKDSLPGLYPAGGHAAVHALSG